MQGPEVLLHVMSLLSSTPRDEVNQSWACANQLKLLTNCKSVVKLMTCSQGSKGSVFWRLECLGQTESWSVWNLLDISL